MPDAGRFSRLNDFFGAASADSNGWRVFAGAWLSAGVGAVSAVQQRTRRVRVGGGARCACREYYPAALFARTDCPRSAPVLVAGRTVREGARMERTGIASPLTRRC